jgi:methionine biosynthesis protein MetW
MPTDASSLEQDIIISWVKPNSSVLDLGCGDGELLERLVKEKQVRAQGIELDEQAIYKCVGRGLSVLHADIDTSLSDYADKSIDYVILKESFQQVKKLELVLRESLRIGKNVIVSFPNFTHYLARLQLFFKGTTPVTPSLPYEWYNTPNLHFLSIKDFIVFCQKNNIIIEHEAYLGRTRRVRLLPNLLALVGLFVISKN